MSVAAGIGLTLAAAIVQASSLRARFIWSFDHNGLFHLLQIAAVIVIARGLRATMQIKPRNTWAGATVSRKP